MAEPEERYIAVDPLILEAIKELAWIEQVDHSMQPILRLALRVAHIAPDGRIVFGVRMIRDLAPEQDQPP